MQNKRLSGKQIASTAAILQECTLFARLYIIYVNFFKYLLILVLFVHRCEDVEYEQQIYPGKFFSKTNTNKQHKKMDKTEL